MDENGSTNKSRPVHILQHERKIFFLAVAPAGVIAEAVKMHGYPSFKEKKAMISCQSVDISLNYFLGSKER